MSDPLEMARCVEINIENMVSMMPVEKHPLLGIVRLQIKEVIEALESPRKVYKMSSEYIDDEDTPLSEAVKYMTDEWIAGGNYSEFTVQRLRDGYKAAEQSVHLTAYRRWLWVSICVHIVTGFVLLYYAFGGR